MPTPPDEMERKRARKDIFSIAQAVPTAQRTQEEVVAAYKDAVRTHPFYDNAHSYADLYSDGVFCDGEGNPVAVLIRGGLPDEIAKKAADVLRPAAVKSSLRTTIYGGESPNSGIAGYFDYKGSPIEFKHRKTAFTYEHADVWPDVFPMVDYVSQLYKHVMPHEWANQNAAIPEPVRIHGSPFSTLTINSRFRTASHTDAGDFDNGYGCLSVLEGDFKGHALTLDRFRVNISLYAGDVLIFNTHHFHSNTELETLNTTDPWSRLTCVFYYRAALGEPNAYSEYHRRLQTALKADLQVSPSLRHIEIKENGVNLNRPDPVHPVDMTPLLPAVALAAFYHCRSQAHAVHKWLLAEGHSATRHTMLFGEPLGVADGIPLRTDGEVEIALMSTWALRAPAMGGFAEHDGILAAATDKEKYFEPDYLEAIAGHELFDMWKTARDHWLGLVKAEWDAQKKRNPKRTDFTWNNRSAMNAAFFDLCDVAKGLLSALTDREAPSAHEQSAFWLLFATHLNKLCAADLNMPIEAMSMRKLNVKLKDFNFGGTRYFKDMPEDEQRRRTERKRRIEEARLQGRAHAHKTSDWLLNDTFDYQSEDCDVDYVANGWERPDAHAARRTLCVTPLLKSPTPCRDTVHILVVLPSRPHPDTAAEGEAPDYAGLRAVNPAEVNRLLFNAAAVRLIQQGPANRSLPSSVKLDGVHIEYAYTDTEPRKGAAYDFVILQHVLATVADDEKATAYVQRMQSVTRGCVVVVETDQQCRQYYTLKHAVRDAYDSVATMCFQALLERRYGISRARVRSKPELLALLRSTECHARFKLGGSPLNTTLLYVSGLHP